MARNTRTKKAPSKAAPAPAKADVAEFKAALADPDALVVPNLRNFWLALKRASKGTGAMTAALVPQPDGSVRVVACTVTPEHAPKAEKVVVCATLAPDSDEPVRSAHTQARYEAAQSR